jgi:hypothetical protein
VLIQSSLKMEVAIHIYRLSKKHLLLIYRFREQARSHKRTDADSKTVFPTDPLWERACSRRGLGRRQKFPALHSLPARLWPLIFP